MKKIRNIIGLIALILSTMALLCLILLDEGNYLAFQADVWLGYAALLSVIIYAFVWIIYAVKDQHWAIKTALIGVPIIGTLFFIVILFSVGFFHPDSRIWSNSQYSVYHESNQWIDPGHFVLYKREGMLEKSCCFLGSEFFNPKNVQYTIYDDLNLICEEADWSFDGRDWHTTSFYRLSDGHPYEQEEKEYLKELIDNFQRTK